MRLVTHHVTSRGGRRANEDALKEVTSREFALLVLADGLGGHEGGALAANTCVDTVAAASTRTPGLSDAALQGLVEEADRAVAALRREQRRAPGSMRTTLAFLAILGNSARWAHVGDSRVYWFRHNVLKQRTRDHSLTELVLGLPHGASVAPADEADRHRLLRAVGAGKGCQADLGGTIVALAGGRCILAVQRWRLEPPARPGDHGVACTRRPHLSPGALRWNNG